MLYDIETKSLKKVYGSLEALAGIDLKVPTGSLFGLLGPNGAGKTTLFSLLSNIIKPSSGEAKILGHEIREYQPLYKQVSVLPQDAKFYRHRSLESQLVYLARLSGCEKSDALKEVHEKLDLVGLLDKRKVKAGTLSFGMTKRLGIAQCLLGDPKVILLDEPLAGLDPLTASKIKDLILSLQGIKTVVISSHNLNDVQSMCTDLAIINKGKLLKQGGMNDILNQNSLVYYRLNSEPDTRHLKIHQAIKELHFDGVSQTLQIAYDHDQLTLDELNSLLIPVLFEMKVGVETVQQGTSLEERFLSWIEEDK